jgi:RHS repeat-associated protein
VSAASTISVKATPSNPAAPANVTLSAMVDAGSDPVLVTQVEYFKGGESLGVVTATPFTLAVNNFAAGTYAIFAKATVADAQGTVLTSPALMLTVAPGPGAANVYFVHSDQLNTPRAVTDSGGNLVWNWDSDPFGNASPNEQPAGPAQFVLNQRFAGQYYDKETNLYYNYFRDYDPQTGRYVQSDPIGLEGGINTYAYVGGNPLAFSDPYGLAPDTPYKTVDAAGIQAIKDINGKSIELDKEFIGCIYCHPDGGFAYTAPQMGTDRSAPPEYGACPAGKKQVAWYHTHGAFRPNFKNNVFSGADQWWSDHKFGPGYLGTTDKKILKYVPNGVPYDGTPSQIGVTK